jgi:hypothetical protein
MPSAYAPALSLHTVRISGCSRSQAANVSASRSGSTSTGRTLILGERHLALVLREYVIHYFTTATGRTRPGSRSHRYASPATPSISPPGSSAGKSSAA